MTDIYDRDRIIDAIRHEFAELGVTSEQMVKALEAFRTANSIVGEVMKMTLAFQVKQFFKPFPYPGSWAYNIQMFIYDLKVGKSVEDESVNIETLFPPKENGNENEDVSIYDIPTYLRRDNDAGNSNPPCE